MKPGFEIMTTVTVRITDDVQSALTPMKAMLGFYIGGMGSKKRNFHKELMGRMGFEAEAEQVQERFMAGDRAGAIAAVPDEFVDEIALVGPVERIRDRLKAWEETPVTHFLLGGYDREEMRRIADVLLGG